ncbi:MAG: PQQ-dependent sugar dehydrogenase [Balneolales bacterium]
MNMYPKMTLSFLIFIAMALFVYGCTSTSDEKAAADAAGSAIQSQHHAFRVVTVVEGLHHPWSIAFLPDGDRLVTERGTPGENGHPAGLRIIRDGVLLPDPVPGLPEIRIGGQGGLLDVVIHPDFEQNRLIYLTYAKPNEDDSEGTTAVIRGRFENDELNEVEEIFEAQAWTSGRGHHGSRLVFDPDGYLFVTVGDRQSSPGGSAEDQHAHPAQDLSNHFGTINRLNDDGNVPADNPFYNQEGALPEIWSYGHRNPQGMAFNFETRELWANEHGPQGGDEINLIQAGLNYGWPVIGFGVNYGVGEPLHHTISNEDMEEPVHHWAPSIAPAGMMVYSGEQFPKWKGSIFSGGMSGQHQVLSRVVTDGTTMLNEELLLHDEMRIRDVRQGPDGYIYLVVDDRGGDPTPIVRLEPVR